MIIEEKKDEGEKIEKMPKDKKKTTGTAAPATIVVNLPVEAQLFVDGHVTTAAAARRVFQSPALAEGKAYTYTLKAELNDIARTKEIEVRAGKLTEVNFDFATDVAAR